MGNIIEEIERIEDAKDAINLAIVSSGGPAGEEDDLIDTYADRVRAIPSAVLSNLNVSEIGGATQYIKTIEQKDGLIIATTGGEVSNLSSGLTPKIVTTSNTTQDSELVLTSNGSAAVWKKLPTNAFANNKVTMTAKSDSVAYPILLGPSSHTSGNTSGAYYDTGVTLNPSTNTITANINGSAKNLAGGDAGSIPYQTAAGTTAFLAKGTSGQVLKMNSSGIPYWTTDNNSNTWRNIQVNSTQIAGTGTNTYALNFVSGTGITAVGTAGSASAANTITFNINASKTDTLGGIKVAKVGTSAITLLEDGSKYYGVNIDSNNKAYVALPAFTTNTGTVTSVTLKAGNGISISSTAAITTNGERTITNTGVRSIAISGNYLQVNTNGSTANLTIPFATTANGAKSLTPYRDLIKITTDDTNTDNPLTWSTVGTSIHMYSVHNSLYSQPSQYGLLLSLAYGQDIHQIWATQSTGNLYHRGGNSAGWANSGSWITILDSANSSVSGDGGDTWGSSITVKINNVSKTLTIPSNPNTDEKVAYTANASNVAHPILFANNSTNTGNPTTGAVYYETDSTNSPGLTYNPYSRTLNTHILKGDCIQINAAIKDHNNPMDQCLCITTPTTNSNLTIKNSPGIGFKVEGKSWASMIFNHQGPCFEFINSSATANVNIKAARLISSIGTGTSPLKVSSTTLVENLNADMLDNLHASDFYKKTDKIDADTLGGHPAEDFFLNTDLLEGFSSEDLTVIATVSVSRMYHFNTSGIGGSTKYIISGTGVLSPYETTVGLLPITLKAPIIKVISVSKIGNVGSYTANEGDQTITVSFNGTATANTGDNIQFTLLLPAFNNS